MGGDVFKILLAGQNILFDGDRQKPYSQYPGHQPISLENRFLFFKGNGPVKP
jgi:hypothetical protein